MPLYLSFHFLYPRSSVHIDTQIGFSLFFLFSHLLSYNSFSLSQEKKVKMGLNRHEWVKDSVKCFCIKGLTLVGCFHNPTAGQGVAQKSTQVSETSPKLQKNIFSNLIPSDIFSKLKAHGFSFILLVTRLLLLDGTVRFVIISFCCLWLKPVI